MKLFLDSGFRFDENFCEFGTPLHYALEVFDDDLNKDDESDFQDQSRDDLRAEIIELIVNNGVEVEKDDIDGFNPLEVALSNMNCGIQIFKKLIDLGANVNHVSAENNITPSIVAASKRTSEFLKVLVSCGADINFISLEGAQAIHFAAKSNSDPDVIRILYKAGADVNRFSENGMNPILIASKSNLDGFEIVKALIECGARIDVTDNNGISPLFFAIANDNLKLVKFLLSQGAKTKLEVPEIESWNALHFAAKYSQKTEIH